jgi:uncharacterized protein (TIRG00374 family)
VLILYRINLNDIFLVLKDSNITYLIMSYALIIPTIMVRSYRWHILLLTQNLSARYSDSLAFYAFSIFIGTLTPGRIGEISKAFHLKRKGISYGKGLLSVVIDRLADAIILVAFGIAAFVTLGLAPVTVNLCINIMILFFVVVLIAYFVYSHKIGKRVAEKFLYSISPKARKEKIVEEFRAAYLGLKGIGVWTIIFVSALSFIAWMVTFYSLYFCAKCLGFSITFFQMASIGAICALVSMLPISVMGIGTREATLIVLLRELGVSEAGAVALSTLIMSLIVFNALICSLSILSKRT